MLHHVSVGVADVERAAKFYDAALKALGYKRVMEFLPYAIGYGDTKPALWVQIPGDRNAPSVGNGSHVAFNAMTKNAVHAFHKAALAAGGTNEGAPGPRPDYGPTYYGAFVRDFDGNKVEAVLVVAQSAAKPIKKKVARKTKARKTAKRKSKRR